ncbi:major facilitator superfamily domain-containing protein [Chiua virens]|nr:major facilitator superfamily domain-containing protein [Chiua virens]
MASQDIKDLDELGPDSSFEWSSSERADLEAVVWRKLDRWILPLCTGFFLLAFLDRTNIGNARLVGLQTSLAMSNYQYSVALTVTYVPYIAAEFPATLLLKHVGPNIMLPAMVTLWGVVAASQGVVTNYSGLLACRFFLGLLEGGLFPGIVLYLSFFYPRKRLQLRVAAFYAASSLSGAFSGLLAAAIGLMNGKGGKPGWAWIFIVEGILTFLFGAISFFLLPRSPETARFLTEKERAYIVSTLKHVGSVSEDNDKDSFNWTEVVRSAKSPHVLLLCVVFFLSGTILFGLAFFEPTIVASLGYAGNQAQLMSVPPFAVTFVLSIVSAIISDRYQWRGYTAIFFSVQVVIGFSMFYASTSNHIRYGSLFFSISGAYCAAPALITWLANNSAPHTRRATAIAAAFIMTQAGGILATWLFGSLSPAPNYTSATITFIVMSTFMVVLSTANLIYLSRENQLKAERRERMTKENEPEGLGDRSAWFIYSL